MTNANLIFWWMLRGGATSVQGGELGRSHKSVPISSFSWTLRGGIIMMRQGKGDLMVLVMLQWFTPWGTVLVNFKYQLGKIYNHSWKVSQLNYLVQLVLWACLQGVVLIVNWPSPLWVTPIPNLAPELYKSEENFLSEQAVDTGALFLSVLDYGQGVTRALKLLMMLLPCNYGL